MPSAKCYKEIQRYSMLHKNCLLMLSDTPDEGPFFCLHWRETRDYCLERCGGFIEGTPQPLSSFPFETTCEFFHRTIYREKDSPLWSDFCLYYKVESPPCGECKIKHQESAKTKNILPALYP